VTARFAVINAVGSGVCGFVGPYVIGMLRDRTCSFTMALVLVAIAPALIVLPAVRRPVTNQ
jgi:hypothetical protein